MGVLLLELELIFQASPVELNAAATTQFALSLLVCEYTLVNICSPGGSHLWSNV